MSFRAVNTDYHQVPASESNFPLGLNGGKQGDILEKLVITPTSTTCGAVTIYDGANLVQTVFNGGSSSVADLQPFAVDLGIRSIFDGWKITTGNNVSVLAVGKFH